MSPGGAAKCHGCFTRGLHATPSPPVAAKARLSTNTVASYVVTIMRESLSQRKKHYRCTNASPMEHASTYGDMFIAMAFAPHVRRSSRRDCGAFVTSQTREGPTAGTSFSMGNSSHPCTTGCCRSVPKVRSTQGWPLAPLGSVARNPCQRHSDRTRA